MMSMDDNGNGYKGNGEEDEDTSIYESGEL